MVDSFQHEVPRARVNITLDVETEEGRKKKELPLKLLVLGDFSGRKSQAPLADRERININKNNFDKVLEDLAPEIVLTIPNRVKRDGSEMRVVLLLDALKKFHPEELIKQIPELRNLLAMRNLLKDLKANVLDNVAFRQALEKMLQDKAEIKELQGQLKQLVKN